jgi:NAD+ diphosphatase
MVAVVAEATHSAITIDETEMADVRWVSKQELLQAYAGTHDSLLPPRAGAIAHFVLQKWLEDSW